jgi:hypothetical protein
MDTLLAGALTLPWRVHCAGCDGQRHSACGNHSGLIVKTISGYCENPFAFPPESLFTFTPEHFSHSPRNPVHLALDYTSVTVQNDSAATRVLNNVIGKSLQCKSNSAIFGAGNVAQSKTGQCSTF